MYTGNITKTEKYIWEKNHAAVNETGKDYCLHVCYKTNANAIMV